MGAGCLNQADDSRKILYIHYRALERAQLLERVKQKVPLPPCPTNFCTAPYPSPPLLYCFFLLVLLAFLSPLSLHLTLVHLFSPGSLAWMLTGPQGCGFSPPHGQKGAMLTALNKCIESEFAGAMCECGSVS